MAERSKGSSKSVGSALKTLERITVLKDLSSDDVKELEGKCRWQEFEADEKILDADDPSAEVYFIIHGSVRIVNYAVTGRQVGFADYGPGNVFGELSAIDGGARSAAVFTKTRCVVAIADRAAFTDLLKQHPEVSLRMLVHLAGIIRSLNDHVLDLSAVSDVQRVYYELLRRAEPSPEGDGSWLIFNMPRHKDLADSIGTSADTVAHALSQLMRAELVKRRAGRLELLDKEKIQRLALMG